MEGILDINHCAICPRRCYSERKLSKGFCRSSDEPAISSICIHRGEEPVLAGNSGICNIFFSHCNLQCVYCQNYQISRNDSPLRTMPFENVISEIEKILSQTINCIGFVSPSHQIKLMIRIMDTLHARGHDPVFIYNSSAYDNHEIIKQLDGRIHVYLPDFKYMDNRLAQDLSGAYNYPEIAIKAIREMFRQKGSSLHLDQSGIIKSGMIIRHLILPGYVENSRKVLRAIAEELSTAVHISLMSQYHPIPGLPNHPRLGRCITSEEYDSVLEEFNSLGFYRGWVQEFESSSNYIPDFEKEHPFENRC